METIAEYPLPCTSPSLVTFSSQIDQVDFKSPSAGNPDWTIQKETSITIEFEIAFHRFSPLEVFFLRF